MTDTKSLAHIKKEKRKFIGFVGGYLIDDGVLTLEQLDRGLLRQLRLAEAGKVTQLGQVLIDLGYITPDALKRAIERRARDQAKAHPAPRRKK